MLPQTEPWRIGACTRQQKPPSGHGMRRTDMTIDIRPATIGDLPLLERRCWRGGEQEMRSRIATQGTCSIVALDDGRPVAQLYIRALQPGYRSPRGLHDGSWWADLSGVDERLALPESAALGCWHVGRLRDADGTEHEAEQYRGRGIGLSLLHGAVAWLRTGTTPFSALIAKAASTDDRAYLGWLGGLPVEAFTAAGFTRLVTFDDPYILAEPSAVPAAATAPEPARFHLMLLALPQ
jgi:hypothetical protein